MSHLIKSLCIRLAFSLVKLECESILFINKLDIQPFFLCSSLFKLEDQHHIGKSYSTLKGGQEKLKEYVQNMEKFLHDAKII